MYRTYIIKFRIEETNPCTASNGYNMREIRLTKKKKTLREIRGLDKPTILVHACDLVTLPFPEQLSTIGVLIILRAHI